MRKGWLVLPLSGLLLFSTGCVPDKVQEEIEKTENENAEKQSGQEDEEVAPEDIEVSEEQKEELESHDHVSEEEAVAELTEEQESIEIDLPKKKMNSRPIKNYRNMSRIYSTYTIKAIWIRMNFMKC